MAERFSQTTRPTLGYGPGNLRASQSVLGTLGYAPAPHLRASGSYLETLGQATHPNLRTSGSYLETLGSSSPHLRVSQTVLKILVVNLEIPVLPIYPTLDGLTYDVEWEPEFFNLSDKTATGASIDLAMSQYPLHTFTLVYSALRNGFFGDPLRYGGTEFSTMMGFFLQTGGTVGRFLFDNPDDDAVTGQTQFTTDGVNSQFGPLVRTFGVSAYNGTEPIGVVNTGATFNLYLNGTLQGPSTYDIITTDPCNQQIKFHSTPAANLPVTTDMSYYYYCQLPKDTLSFRKFVQKIWDLGQIQIHSCRPGA